MATSVWKGHLTFGLVSIPVKLYRAARAEKTGFRQVHEATGTRVRQTLYRESEQPVAGPVRVEFNAVQMTGITPGRSALKRQMCPVQLSQVEVRREEICERL